MCNFHSDFYNRCFTADSKWHREKKSLLVFIPSPYGCLPGLVYLHVCVCACAHRLACLQSFCTKLYMTLLWLGCHSSVYLSLLTNQIALRWFSPQRRRWDVITARRIFPLMCCWLLSGKPGAKQSCAFRASLRKTWKKKDVPKHWTLICWCCFCFWDEFSLVQDPPWGALQM